MSDIEHTEAKSEPAGRAESIEDVMAEYQAPLLRYATRLVNDPNAAQDVVQDTFIKLCRGWEDGARPTDKLKGWLYRVTHNHAVDYIRRESRLRVLHEKQAEKVETSTPAAATRSLEHEDAMKLALQHIRKLKPEEQQVVVLRLEEGLSYKEIAEITDRTAGNVGCILHHAVKKLSQSLKRAGAL